MAFKLLGGGSSLDTVVNDMNQNILQLKNDELTKVFKDDQGTPVVILNKDGLRTTAPGSGVDVTTASDAQLSFNSNRNALLVVKEGSISINASTLGGAYTNTVAHGQSKPPLVYAYVTTPFLGTNTLAQVPAYSFDQTNFGYRVASTLWVDATNITFQVDLVRGSGNVGIYTFKYFILQESAT